LIICSALPVWERKGLQITIWGESERPREAQDSSCVHPELGILRRLKFGAIVLLVIFMNQRSIHIKEMSHEAAS
jgi:hypothetical protein